MRYGKNNGVDGDINRVNRVAAAGGDAHADHLRFSVCRSVAIVKRKQGKGSRNGYRTFVHVCCNGHRFNM